MPEKGKGKDRALESFGLAGLMNEEVEIFYDVLFDTRHLGRVSDLIVARMQGVNEIKNRALFIFGVFQAYQAQSPYRDVVTSATMGKSTHETPLLMECGIDGQKFAIGLSFTLGRNVLINTTDLAQRVSENQPNDPFEELMVVLRGYADRLVLKYQPDSRKVEVVSIVGLGQTGHLTDLKSKPPLEIVMIEPGEALPAPPVKLYANLGDLNYHRLLRNERGGYLAELPPGTVKPPLLSKVRKKGSGLDDGDGEGWEEGDLEGDLDFAMNHPESSGEGESEKNTTQANQGKDQEGDEDEAEDEDDFWDSLQRIILRWAKSLFKPRVRASAAGIETGVEARSEARSEAGVEAGLGSGEEEQSENLEGHPPTQEGTAPEAMDSDVETSSEGKSPADSEDSSLLGSASPVAETKQLALDLREGEFDRILKKMAEEKLQIRKHLKNPKLVRWVQSVMDSLAAEKGRLAKKAEQLNQALQQQDAEVRKKVQTLKEELKKKDQQLMHKGTALLKTEEKLAQTTKFMEKLKSSVQKTSEIPFLKQKAQTAEKALAKSREEVTRLSEKIDELRAQAVYPSGSAQPTQREAAAVKLASVYKKEGEMLKQRIDGLEKELAALKQKESPQISSEASPKKTNSSPQSNSG